jgi:hypothetical protein
VVSVRDTPGGRVLMVYKKQVINCARTKISKTVSPLLTSFGFFSPLHGKGTEE